MVILLVIIVIVAKGVGYDKSKIGLKLLFYLFKANNNSRRQVYTRLRLLTSEEELLYV